jgi:hypothetical protein
VEVLTAVLHRLAALAADAQACLDGLQRASTTTAGRTASGDGSDRIGRLVWSHDAEGAHAAPPSSLGVSASADHGGEHTRGRVNHSGGGVAPLNAPATSSTLWSAAASAPKRLAESGVAAFRPVRPIPADAPAGHRQPAASAALSAAHGSTGDGGLRGSRGRGENGDVDAGEGLSDAASEAGGRRAWKRRRVAAHGDGGGALLGDEQGFATFDSGPRDAVALLLRSGAPMSRVLRAVLSEPW